MNRASSSFALLPLLLVACGGKVVIDSASGAGTGAGGSAASAAGGAATTGIGGASSVTTGVGGAASVGAGGGVVGTGISASASATVGAGGSSAACPAGNFGLAVDGAVVSLDFSCLAGGPPVPVPFMQVSAGGPPPGYEGIVIEGCATPDMVSQGITFTTDNVYGPGTFTSGALTYTDASGMSYTAVTGFEWIIYEFAPVGSLVVGSFEGMVTNGNVTHDVQGKYAVCRLPDEDLP